MSHSSGIAASPDLTVEIKDANTLRTRMIKVVIKKEQLFLDCLELCRGTWEQDFDEMVLKNLKPSESCYIFYKLDKKYTPIPRVFPSSSLGPCTFEWLLITFVPESASPREKMLYASSKSTVKLLSKPLNIVYEISSSTLNECSLEGFKNHVTSLSAPKPLTRAEKQLLLIKQNEEEMKKQGKRQTMKSISFPTTFQLNEELEKFRQQISNFILMSIDVPKEEIQLSQSAIINAEELPSNLPKNKSCFALFSFNHPSISRCNVFIHTIPVSGGSIKEKMVYSASKTPFIQFLQENFVPIHTKIETDSPEELTLSNLIERVQEKDSKVSNGALPPKF